MGDKGLARGPNSMAFPGLKSCTKHLAIEDKLASTTTDPDFPDSFAIDGNTLTRWAAKGIGSWIRLWLGGGVKDICRVDIYWYNGNARKYNFVIEKSSLPDSSYISVFSGKSSGTTVGFESYNFPITSAKYVRITVNGNTENEWASIYELNVYGPV